MYSVLVIDPPWPKKKGGLRSVRPNQTRQLDYETLSVDAIFNLLDREIFPLASDPHIVFLWGVEQFLVAGECAMLSRGYRQHIRLVWDKTNGVAPAFTVRFSHEYLTWFYKPSFIPIAKGVRGKYCSVIRAKAREHSRKPDEAYKMIEEFFPDSKRIDVFSREPRIGWDQWGNECTKFS